MPAFSPEEQLRHVAQLLLTQTEITRPHNGRGRSRSYAAGTEAIAGTGRQLAEMVLAYLDGKLAPVEDNSAF